MLREAGATIAIPRLAQICAQGNDADAVKASAVILDKALPAQVEGDTAGTQFVVLMPPKAKTTSEWLRLHGRGEA